MSNKNANISAQERQLLSEKLRAVLGFHFPETRFDEMERRLESSLRQPPARFQHDGISALINAAWDQTVIDALVPNLSTGETYFFRDLLLWQYIESDLIPFFHRQLNSGHRNNIYSWSAGCCTGEEPFTLAIIFRRLLSQESLKHFPIFASDLSKQFLEQARTALYSTWAMRATPAEIKSSFFNIEANKFKLSPSVSSMVRFFYHNLLDAQRPVDLPVSGLDLIFCRNVLIYFDNKQSLQVVKKLASYLNEDGYLILSPHDIGIAQQSNVEVLSYIDNALLCKRVRAKPQSLPRATVLSNQQANIGEGMSLARKTASGFINKSAQVKAAELAKDGKYAEAAETLQAHVKTDKCTDEDRKLLIQCYCNKGDTKTALDCCAEAINQSPLQPIFYYLKASLEEEAGNHAAAAKTLQQALFLEPKFIIAHYALFNNCRKSGKTKQVEICRRNILGLLDELDSTCQIPESDGLTAGQLRAIILSTDI